MTDTALADEVHGDADHADHPSDLDYVKVAIGLGVLTAIEVAIFYIEGLEGLAMLVPMFIIMAIKFVLVASQFMHLKFDHKLLSRVFYAGLILAVAVYVITLATFEVFSGNDCPGFAASEHHVELCAAGD